MESGPPLSKWIKIIRNRLPKFIDIKEEYKEYIRSYIIHENDFIIKSKYNSAIRVYGSNSHWVYKIKRNNNSTGWTTGIQNSKELAMLCADIEAVRMGYCIEDALIIID